MDDTKKLFTGATFGLFLGDIIVHIMNPAIPILSLVMSNVLAILFLVLYTNYKKRKYRKEELPDIDERVNENIKKYVNVSFVFTFLLLIVYIVVSKVIGRAVIPVQEIFIICSSLFAGSLIIGVMIEKRA
ncbi:TPA: hypothetical protein ROY30_001425 [Bacillus cereus]|uniref:hypothetical protein n=1 Tax=Bacillus TaxID=1386 RepID=UPI000863E90A|nr:MULTISPECIES: hypothetical protein [Bacillus]MCP1177241.1 hypothetical protein [Bacillus sp. 1663tsa1]MCP1283158.1 hypothetical protein [Bacillus sp. S0635]MCQ6347451.1 hypothetical protein [Bacillus cereus]MCU5748400.1 hypothetical protein [Bacillus cereus]MDA1634294.1 hypothetical protein [Bacillus cereus]